MNNIANNRYLIVFDLDGTLLDSEKKIQPKTEKMICYLRKKGNIVSIASGRPGRSVKEYSDFLSLGGPYAGYNGALIEDPYDAGFKSICKRIKKEILLDFLSHFGESAFDNLMIEDEINQYYLHENEDYVNFFHPEGMKIHIGSVIENLQGDVRTCVMKIMDPSLKDEMKKYLESIVTDMSIRWWADTQCFGEFVFHDTNKSTAVNYLSSYYGIENNHVICFGDAMNDEAMIQNAGVSYAMKNGDERLKKIAKNITPYDNDHEGIYYALLDFFHLKEEEIMQ